MQCGVLRLPSNSRWLEADHIRLIWKREVFDFTTSTATTDLELEIVDYRVAVNRKELVLTRTRDGKVFRFRRVD